MKNLIRIFLLAAFSPFLFSCLQEEEPLVIHPPKDQEAWEIFQLVKIHVPNLNSSDESFSGSIDGVPISLGRIPGDNLVFIIPNVGDGPAQVKVSIGKQTRKWNLDLVYWPYYEDQKKFLGRVLKTSRELKSKILEVDKLKELADPFGQWIEFFNQKQLALSGSEKDFLSGSLQNGLNGRFLPRPDEKFEWECINGPAFTLSSNTYRFLNFDNSYLVNYKGLPSNRFHEAVLAGLGLSFWYQKVFHEYYAHLTLECPQLRDLELKKQSGNVILPGEILKIESNESVSFGYNGIFKPLTASDLKMDNSQFIVHAVGFRDKEGASKLFSEMVRSYSNTYGWDLPALDSKAFIIPPEDAPISKGPLPNFKWDLLQIDNSNIRLVNYIKTPETFTIKLESRDGNPQPFNLSVSVRTNSDALRVVVPALLEVTCPILVNVLLIERTHHLDIEFGQSPYTIFWSNGISGDLSQTLSPGNYDIKVTDADGCERTIPFTVPEFGTVEDIDGNVYETVKIGNTWWMTENLRTTRKKDGTSIQLIEPDAAWISTNMPAYSWKENDSSLDESYGKLYNYYAACCDICPQGWRIAGIPELASLREIFGVALGRNLRNVNGWPTGSLKSTNLSGLRFLPSGFRWGTDGSFKNFGEDLSIIWTSFKEIKGNPVVQHLNGSDHVYQVPSFNLRDGFSVRCVK